MAGMEHGHHHRPVALWSLWVAALCAAAPERTNCKGVGRARGPGARGEGISAANSRVPDPSRKDLAFHPILQN